MALNKYKSNKLFIGLAFIVPNLLGFMSFTLIPLLISFFIAFTNRDLSLHNMFRSESMQFIGIENFVRLYEEPDFWKNLRNTLFLLMGIPIAIAGSLAAAIFLSKDLKSDFAKVNRQLIAGACVIGSILFLLMLGLQATATTLLLTGVFGLVLVGGVSSGTTLYRTLLYLPYLTLGVPTFILWKKLYNPHTGPINTGLEPMLGLITEEVRTWPETSGVFGMWLILLPTGWLMARFIRSIEDKWHDGDLGSGSHLLCLAALLTPVVLAANWLPDESAQIAAKVGATVTVVYALYRTISQKRFEKCAIGKGFWSTFVPSVALMAVVFAMLGAAIAFHSLPIAANKPDGILPPEWLLDYEWAKPSLIIVGLWAAVGSNNLILYIAGINNIPEELHDAATIDGASASQRFWSVTWPQLAPITLFIVVMNIIEGLQGGFDMARVMTQGGPGGATTTLTFYVYEEAFSFGNFGYGTAICWTLFALVLVMTFFNSRFGKRYIDE